MNFETQLEQFKLKDYQLNQLRTYAQFLNEKNKVMNLTAIDDLEGVTEKHFVDSLLIGEFLTDSKTFCDVGSGAGFPGVVLAIAYPDIEFTLVEPTGKRCQFLNDLTDLLKLSNVNVVNARAEDYVKEMREQFDVVSARAVANLVILSELCLPLVKVGGQFIAMKGQRALEELEQAQFAIKTLGGEVFNSQKSMLRDGSLRYNIIVKKVKSTPQKYPRAFGKIKKNPLNKKKGG